MIINAEDGKQIYFTHIPRTGGRYVRELFLHNGYVLDLVDFPVFFYNYEVPHLHYPLNEIYLAVNGYNHEMPKFTVIRNPITRLKSFIKIAVSNYGIPWNEIHSMEDFVRLMERLKTIFHIFWAIPQIDFIGGCELWKFENGFEDAFCRWVEDLYDISLPITKPNVDMGRCREVDLKSVKFSDTFDEYASIYFENEMKTLGY